MRAPPQRDKMICLNMNAPKIDAFPEALRRPIKQQYLNYVLGERPPMDDAQLWERAFQPRGVALDTVMRIRRILSDILEVDLHRLRARDDFSKELSFFWDWDSLADLKIMHALEEEFKIRISDAEAEGMKCLRDIVVGVHAKISAPSGLG